MKTASPFVQRSIQAAEPDISEGIEVSSLLCNRVCSHLVSHFLPADNTIKDVSISWIAARLCRKEQAKNEAHDQAAALPCKIHSASPFECDCKVMT